jgi:hypothetical protein
MGQEGLFDPAILSTVVATMIREESTWRWF